MGKDFLGCFGEGKELYTEAVTGLDGFRNRLSPHRPIPMIVLAMV
jgi:hypothetical protein